MPMSYLNGRTVAVALACAGALIGGTFTIPASAAPRPRVPIAGTHPSWAVPARRAGASLPAGTLQARVYLAPRDPAGLAALATEVSTPGSPLYRRFLTPAQIQADFGVPATRLSALKSWLTGAGLRVTRVSDHVADGYVAVSGSLAAASRAFDVTFANYRLAGQGVVRAPQEAASTPASVATSVLSVSGLDTARTVMKPLDAGTVAATSKLPPPGPNYW